MQLIKTQEAELLQVYGKYFDSYLSGDVEKVATLLNEEYTQIGSAESEVFFSKKDAVEIAVKDNDNGMPQKVLDKIFQPFFTTKPTGQGTGLGLSLAYDIVKAHGGEIKVLTKEGEGTEFIFQLSV